MSEMVHYYFSSTQFTHTWEEIVRALWEIGETETADRIVRTRNLDMSLPSNDCPPPLPPRNGPVLQSDFDNQEAFSDQSFIAPGQESSEIEDIASKSQGHNHPQTESPDSPLVVVAVPQEPVYKETKEALDKLTLTSDPSSDSTQAEHQYSEVSGGVGSQESGVHCAQLDNKRDPGGGQSSEDPTRVQYARIGEQRLPVSNDIHVLVEDVPAPPPRPPTPETVHPEPNSCVDPIPDSGQKEGECVPGQIHSLPNDSLHEKEEYGRKITAEKCSLKQMLNGSVQPFVGQSSPKMTVRLDAETSELKSLSSDIKDNAQMEFFPHYECSSTSAYSQQDVPPKPKAHTLTCSSSELIHTKEVVQVRKQGQESRESKNKTDEPSDNSLDKTCSPESADVEHLNNSTCDEPSVTNDLNNLNCVRAEASFQAGKSEPVLNEMPITNVPKPSSTCCTGTLALNVSSRTVVTGTRSNYQSLGGYKLPTQTTDSPNCGQEHNRDLMVGRDFQAEVTKKVTIKHYKGIIGKSTSIWSQLIATVSNNVLSFDEFQRSTTARTKPRSDSVVNPKSSEEKVEEKGLFPKDLKPVTYSPDSDSHKKLVVVKIVDEEASSKSFREASGKAQGEKEQHRMWPWKLHTLPPPPQDWNDINTEDGLQLPKHGVLFQPLSLGHRLLAWRAEF